MDIREHVKSEYGAVARSGLSSRNTGVRAVAEAFGYTDDELASIPAEANMGLSCGNPTAFATLRPGETVVDLGCGGGLDVLLAAHKVGPAGKVIGIDMTEEMIALARRNAAKSGGGRMAANIEFHLATIDRTPLADATVDCVISNCVINLAPDKRVVFREMSRILKPGGRLAVSDIALKRPLPPELDSDVLAYAGCIAGAIALDEYRQGLLDSGFADVEIVDTRADLNVYGEVASAGCIPAPQATSPGLAILDGTPHEQLTASDAALHARLRTLLERYDLNDYAASVKVFAVKPR